MYEDAKMTSFFQKERWERAIQHCIDKGIRPEKIGQYITPQFRALLCEYIEEGRYKIAPPHVALIPKDNGEFRKVYVNTDLDRLTLGIINSVYCDMYEDMIHPCCVSYRKGIGVKNISRKISSELQKHKGFAGYKIDISKYFDSVNQETLNKTLDEISTGSPLDKVIKDYYSEDLILDENGELVEHYKSIAQGCAFGSFLANIVLRDVDETIGKMVPIYYRYSDDILIIGRNSDKALEKLKEMLVEKGLKINPKKVEKISSDKWFTFLGCQIKGKKISLSKKSLSGFQKKMKEIIGKHQLSSNQLKGKIKQINQYLYSDYLNNKTKFGWAEYFFGIINCEEDIVAMDEWLKDLLRGAYTGKMRIGGLGSNPHETGIVARGKGRNVRTNMQKTDNLLQNLGYLSMHNMYLIYHTNKVVYEDIIWANRNRQ